MPTGSNFNPSVEFADTICRLYAYGFSCESVGRFVGVNRVTVNRFLIRKGIELRPSGMTGRRHTQDAKDAVGDGNRTGRNSFVTSDGYVMIWHPYHPYANCNGYVREHRLMMEAKLGRYLSPEETVHHKDEIRDNND